MGNLAVIPARGGSKRIPRKNIKLFNGRPIISYSIECALRSGLFDQVMVSTDDEEIANVAKNHGAAVPFLRSKKNSDDYASSTDVVKEVVDQYKNEFNIEFENVCMIYATAPLIDVEDLKVGYSRLSTLDLYAVLPVTKFMYPVQRSLKKNGELISFVWPENKNRRSQDLQEYFHDAGQWYWMKKGFYDIFYDKTSMIEISPLRVQDIDTEEDWTLAEHKYKMLSICQ